MEEEVTLKTIVLLLSGGILLMSILWGFLYITLIKKSNTIFTMLNILAKGITDQHKDINDNLSLVYQNLTEQHSMLDKIKDIKEYSNKNDFH